MPVLDYAGLKIEVDEDGYLVHSSEWNEKVGCGLAVNEGIDEITVERMDVIKFMREYYAKYNIFPILGSVCRNVHQTRDCVKERFIDPLKAWKIAGLPRPSEQIVSYLRGEGGVV